MAMMQMEMCQKDVSLQHVDSKNVAERNEWQ